MNKYGLHAGLKATNGNSNKLAKILIEASKLVSTAKGCHLYIVSIDKQDNNTVWVTEIWDSKEDHDNSLNSKKVRDLISQAIPIIDGKPEKRQELEILGGAGIK